MLRSAIETTNIHHVPSSSWRCSQNFYQWDYLMTQLNCDEKWMTLLSIEDQIKSPYSADKSAKCKKTKPRTIPLRSGGSLWADWKNLQHLQISVNMWHEKSLFYPDCCNHINLTLSIFNSSHVFCSHPSIRNSSVVTHSLRKCKHFNT